METGVFLNISRDHISPLEHRNFEDYFQAKLKLFSHCRNVCVNLDADHASRVLAAAACAERVILLERTAELWFAEATSGWKTAICVSTCICRITRET